MLLLDEDESDLTATSEGDLASDPDVARWTPISVAYAVPAGYLAQIIVRIGENSALWMVAYDESIPGDSSGPVQGHAALAPLFADKSVVSVGGSFGSDRTFSAAILPNGGWQRDRIKLVPYLVKEVV